MFSLSTSNSDLRLATVVLLALLSLALVDNTLYHNRFFLHYFGDATQEGQVVAKKERALHYASMADIILFGSSFTRSGVSSEPFTAAGRVVFNAAVSGGGPIYSYYALDEMALLLRKREKKPLLVLELHPDALLQKRPLWSEYPQFNALVRERGRVLHDFPLLFQNYLAYGQASRFLSGLLFPSLIYREHHRQVYHNWSEFQVGHKPMGGYFVGMEDHGGYAPIYTSAAYANCAGEAAKDAVLPLQAFEPTKVTFLRRFLALAAALDAPVLLIERPNICHDQLMAGLVDALRLDYPSLKYLPSREFGLAVEEFQSPDLAAHPNIWGADKVGGWIVRQMEALESTTAANGESFHARWDGLYGAPKMVNWAGHGLGVSKLPSGVLRFAETERRNIKQDSILARSAEIVVEPGREYILESRAAISGGLLMVQLESRGSADTQFHDEGFYRLPESAREFRHFIRFRPSGGRLRILLHDADPQRPVMGEFALLRLVEAAGQ